MALWRLITCRSKSRKASLTVPLNGNCRPVASFIRVDLPHPDRRAGCLHTRGTVVRDPGSPCLAQNHGLSRDSRLARGRFPRRPHFRDVGAAGTRAGGPQCWLSAAARSRSDIYKGISGHRLRVALAHREGATVTRRVNVRLAPWVYTAVLLLFWESVVRVLSIPVFFLPPPSIIAEAFVDFWGPIYRNSLVHTFHHDDRLWHG